MAENPIESSDASFNDGSDGPDKEKHEDANMSLERKDSLKSRTMKKHGHLRVKEDGQLTYKRTPSSALMAAIQLGIGYSVGRLTAKQERDILFKDFSYVEKVWFPGSGSRETPSHRFNDFKFKSYAPSAFRYFRDLFGMQPSEFLMALSNEELRELSNPGASGSLFFLSADDNFIIKTVQHKEATFLQQLLPGYYMNLHQNPRTLLPKFFGLYCYQSQNVNIRLVVMNNILKSTFRCHQLYDLKGSTFKRKASKSELSKKTPTKKDLDFRNDYSEGIVLEADLYDAVVKTINRDCRVLESFKIMDYSLLLGIHNIDLADREKGNSGPGKDTTEEENPERVARREEFGAALEAFQIDKEGRPLGGIPATSPKGDRLILFIGIIDILQSYRMAKKLEHGWKSLIHDGDSVSVHNPSFYAKRFISFMGEKVFRRGPSAGNRASARRRSHRNRTTTNDSLGDAVSPAEISNPKPKDGKSKAVSVKFSEATVIYDNDLQDQMIPPPYESQDSKEAVSVDTQPGEGVENDVNPTIVTIEGSAAEAESPAREARDETEAVNAEDSTTEKANDVEVEEINVVTKTSTADSSQRKEDSSINEPSHLGAHDSNRVEATVAGIENTVSYSNTVTVVTSTISHETVVTKREGNEVVSTIMRSESTGSEAQEESRQVVGKVTELNNMNHVIHVEAKEVEGENSEGYSAKGESNKGGNSKGDDVKGGSTKGDKIESDSSKIVEECNSSDIEVTNIDAVLAETVVLPDAKIVDTNADSYQVNDVMVTKI